MNVLLTGLCLSGNRGGPALALALMDQVRAVRPDMRITMVVPGAGRLAEERRWAGIFGVDAVADVETHELRPRVLFRAGPRSAARRLVSAYRHSDGIIDMSGVAYVGPPTRPFRAMLRERRVRHRALAELFRKPLLAWTQSYGPLEHPLARRLAAADFSRLPIVFCRGVRTAEVVQSVCPDAICRVYPDVAVTLQPDSASGDEQLAALSVDGPFASFSPSAVMFGRSPPHGGARYIAACAEMVRWLQQEVGRVVLVPHTRFGAGAAPTSCDLAVCRLVIAALDAPSDSVHLVADDLGPRQLKGILARASIHVGSRYHALIGSLSGGVPSLALAWHPKYADMMQQFGVPERVVATQARPGEGWAAAAALLLRNAKTDAEQIRDAIPKLQAAVQANATEFVRTFEGML